jgi:hypothetical protein
MEAAKAWYDSPAYRAIRHLRMDNAKYTGVLVERAWRRVKRGCATGSAERARNFGTERLLFGAASCATLGEWNDPTRARHHQVRVEAPRKLAALHGAVALEPRKVVAMGDSLSREEEQFGDN